MRHVVVMTATGAVGLIAIFVVDLLSLLYVSWLGDPRLTAGVGFATIVLFLTVSINIGLMIAVGALVSRALGAASARGAPARRLLLPAHGRRRRALALASCRSSLAAAPARRQRADLRSPWLPLDRAALQRPDGARHGLSAVLRAVGDARRAMYVTLSGAVVTAVLDPLLIFGLGLGTDGAADRHRHLARDFVCGRLPGRVRVHDLVARPSSATCWPTPGRCIAIAVPAILTNVATPLANAVFASIIARFGDQAIAAIAIIDRLVPVAFGGLFALSGAVGPILGQNWGAGRFDRMRAALKDRVIFMGVVRASSSGSCSSLLRRSTVLFKAQGLTAELVGFFCLISGPMWFFVGLLFVANAAFNNLGFPLLSTGFNWGRATLGTCRSLSSAPISAGPRARWSASRSAPSPSASRRSSRRSGRSGLERRTRRRREAGYPSHPGGAILSAQGRGSPARDAAARPKRSSCRSSRRCTGANQPAVMGDRMGPSEAGEHHDQLVRPDAAGPRRRGLRQHGAPVRPVARSDPCAIAALMPAFAMGLQRTARTRTHGAALPAMAGHSRPSGIRGPGLHAPGAQEGSSSSTSSSAPTR